MLSRIFSILDQELENPKKTSPFHLLSFFLGSLENTQQCPDGAPSMSRWLSDGCVPNTISPPYMASHLLGHQRVTSYRALGVVT